MVLTEEQRLRMESNRRIALKRLTHSAVAHATPPVEPLGNASASGSADVSPLSTFQSTAVKRRSSSKASGTSTSSKCTAVRCVLKNRETFEVLSGYHPGLVEIFRSVPKEKSTYNASTKTWQFSIDMYGPIAASVEKLQPPVKFEGLPQIVLRVFKEPIGSPVSEEQLESIGDTIYGRLFLFQKHAVRFIISRNGRVLLADEMGLGKTIEALAAAVYYIKEWPLLVVCPSSVKCTWAEEITQNVPSLDPSSICIVNASTDNVLCKGDCQVFILSYDIMVSMEKKLIEKQFKIVIMDECHNIKNFKTRRYQAAHHLLKSARRALLLSGTPALSKPSELFTQISCVAPNIFRNFREFGQRYCDPKEVKVAGKTIWKYSGASNLEELQLLLRETIMLRRSKQEVLSELPPKIRKTVILSKQMVDTGVGSLREVKRFYENSKHAHEALLSFYGETAQVKLPAVIEYVTDLVDAGKKFIVFAHHQVVLDALSSLFASKRVLFVRIDGNVTSEKRKAYCDKFQTSDDVRIALLSITAASTGITLTAARLVVFAELFWNPGVLIQAEDRAHRVGQLDSVLIEYLVAKGTADDQLWVMLKKKLEILKRGGLSEASFTAADNTALPCSCDGAADFGHKDGMRKSPFAKMDGIQRSLNDFIPPTEDTSSSPKKAKTEK